MPGAAVTGQTVTNIIVVARAMDDQVFQQSGILRIEFPRSQTVQQTVKASGTIRNGPFKPTGDDVYLNLFDLNADNCKPRFCGRKTEETNVLHCQLQGLVGNSSGVYIEGSEMNFNLDAVVVQRFNRSRSYDESRVIYGECIDGEFTPVYDFGSGEYPSLQTGHFNAVTLTPENNWIGATTVFTVYMELRLAAQVTDYIYLTFPYPVQPTKFLSPVTVSQSSMDFKECTVPPPESSNTMIRCVLNSVSNYWAAGEKPTFKVSNIIINEHPISREPYTNLTAALCASNNMCIDVTSENNLARETIAPTWGRLAAPPKIEALDPYIGWTTTYRVTVVLRHRTRPGYHFTLYIKHDEDELPPDSHIDVSSVSVVSHTPGVAFDPPTIVSSKLLDRKNKRITPMDYGLWSGYGERRYGDGPTVSIAATSDAAALVPGSTIVFDVQNVVNPTEARNAVNDLDVVHFGCLIGEWCMGSDSDIDWHFEGTMQPIRPAPLTGCLYAYDTDYVTKLTTYTITMVPATTRTARLSFAYILPINTASVTAGRTVSVTGVTTGLTPTIEYEPTSRNLTISYSSSVTVTKDVPIVVTINQMQNPVDPQPAFSDLIFQIIGPRIRAPASTQVLEECTNAGAPEFIFPPLGFTKYIPENPQLVATTSYTIQTIANQPILATHMFDVQFPVGTTFGPTTTPTVVEGAMTFNGACTDVTLSGLPGRRCRLATATGIVLNTPIKFKIDNVINPPFPGHLQLNNIAFYHKDSAGVVLSQTVEADVEKTWYGPLGEVSYVPANTMTGETTTYDISVALRHFAQNEDSFFIYMPLNGFFNNSIATVTGVTANGGAAMRNELCAYIVGPPAFVNCTIANVGNVMGNSATVTFQVTNVVNPPLAYSAMNSTKISLMRGNVMKDMTDRVRTPVYIPGSLGPCSIVPRIATTATTTTYDITMKLRLAVAVSELIHITFPYRTLFEGIPVAKATGSDLTAGAAFGTCVVKGLMVTCPVTAVGSTFKEHATVHFELSNVINPPHKPNPVYNNITISITDNGPYGFIKDQTFIATTPVTTVGSLGACRLVPWEPISAVTTSYTVLFQLRHLAVVGNHMRVSFPPGTRFNGVPAGTAAGETLAQGGSVGNCVIRNPLQIDCEVLATGTAFTVQKVINFTLTNVINPIEVHPEITNLHAELVDADGDLIDYTDVMVADATFTGKFFSTQYTPIPSYTAATAEYLVNMHIRQQAFTNDVLEFSFQTGTKFEPSVTAVPLNETLTNNGQIGACTVDSTALRVTCPIANAGTAFAENATVALKLTGIVNPPHPPRPLNENIVTTLYGLGKTWKKDMLNESTCFPITYGPLTSGVLTPADVTATATTQYSLEFNLRLPVSVTDMIEVNFPPGTRFLASPFPTMSTTAADGLTFDSCTGVLSQLRCVITNVGTLVENSHVSVKIVNIINSGSHPALNNVDIAIRDKSLNIKDKTFATTPAIIEGSLTQASYTVEDTRTGATTSYKVVFTLGSKPLRVNDQIGIRFPEFTSSSQVPVASGKHGSAFGTCTREDTYVTCPIINVGSTFNAGASVEFTLEYMMNPPAEYSVSAPATLYALDSVGNSIDKVAATHNAVVAQILPGVASLTAGSTWTGTTTTYDVVFTMRQELKENDFVRISFRDGTTFTNVPVATSTGDALTKNAITWGTCDTSASVLTCPIAAIGSATGQNYQLQFKVTDVTNPVHPPLPTLNNVNIAHLNIRRDRKDYSISTTSPVTSIGDLGPIAITAASTILGQTTSYHFTVKLRYPLKVGYGLVMDFPFGTTFTSTHPVASLEGNSATGSPVGTFGVCTNFVNNNETRVYCPVTSLGGNIAPHNTHAFGLQMVLTYKVEGVINAVDVPPVQLPERFLVVDDTFITPGTELEYATQDHSFAVVPPQLVAGQLGAASITPRILTTSTTTTYDIRIDLRQRIFPWDTIEVVFPQGTTFEGIPVAKSLDPVNTALTFDPCTKQLTSIFCRVASINLGVAANYHRNRTVQVPPGYLDYPYTLHYELSNVINTPHPGYPDLNNVTIRVFDSIHILRDNNPTVFAPSLIPGIMLNANFDAVQPYTATTTSYLVTIVLRHRSHNNYKFEINFPPGTLYNGNPIATPLKTTRAKLGKFKTCEPRNATTQVVCDVLDEAAAFGPFMTVDFSLSNIINRPGVLPAQNNLVIRHLDPYDVLIDTYTSTTSRAITTAQLGPVSFVPTSVRAGDTTVWTITMDTFQPILQNDRIHLYFPYLTMRGTTNPPVISFTGTSGVTVGSVEFEDVTGPKHFLHLSFIITSLGTDPLLFDNHRTLTFTVSNLINPTYEINAGNEMLANRRLLITTGPHTWTSSEIDKDETNIGTMSAITVGAFGSTPAITTSSACVGGTAMFTVSFTLRVYLVNNDWIEIIFPTTTNINTGSTVIATATVRTTTFKPCEWDGDRTLRCQVLDAGDALNNVPMAFTLSNMIMPVAPVRAASSDNTVTIWDPTRTRRKDHSTIATFPASTDCNMVSAVVTRADTYPGATSTNTIAVTLHHFASPGDILEITFPPTTAFVTDRPAGPAATTIGNAASNGGTFETVANGGWIYDAGTPNRVALKIASVASTVTPNNKPGTAFLGYQLSEFTIAGVINPPRVHGDLNNIVFTLYNSDKSVIKDTFTTGFVAANAAYDCGPLIPAQHEGAHVGWGPAVTFTDTYLNGNTKTLSVANYVCQSGYVRVGTATRTCQNTGWDQVAPTCVDVDECTEDPGKCGSWSVAPWSSTCLNTLGGYVCTPHVVPLSVTTVFETVPASDSTQHDPDPDPVEDPANPGQFLPPVLDPLAPYHRRLKRTGAPATVLKFQIYGGSGTNSTLHTMTFGHDDMWTNSPRSKISSECIVSAVTASGTAGIFDVTCAMTVATGLALQGSVRFCYIAAHPDTYMCMDSLHMGGKITYPPPVITPATSQSITYPLSNDALTDAIYALTNLGETIRFKGSSFSPITEQCIITYGTDAIPNMYTCRMLPALSSDTQITCVTEDHRDGVGLKFTVNCGGMSIRGTDTYTYPVNPIVDKVEGCGVNTNPETSECPTAGQIELTITGSNFLHPYLTFVDGKPCVSTFVGIPTSTEVITCTLPVGSGLNVPIFVSARAKFSVPQYILSYSVPRITAVSPLNPGAGGCQQGANATTLVGCTRTGGDEIVVEGTNFGLSGSFAFIGGLLCTDLVHDSTTPHTKVVCKTPPGSRLERVLVIFQYSGESSTESVSISYAQCPKGQINNGPTGCVPCAKGTYSDDEGSDICVSCPIGKISTVEGSTSCQDCSAGTYNTLPGLSVCTDCPVGRVQAFEGRSECVSCLPGQYLAEEGKTTCLECPAGMYQPDLGASACLTCDKGTYTEMPSQHKCSICPKGMYQPAANATGCLACEKGTYQSEPGQSECINCAKGFFNPLTHRDACTACPFGKYQDSEKQTDCIECAIGYFQSNTGRTTCEACGEGYYQDVKAQASCKPCMRGTYETRTARTVCIECPIGTYNTEEHLTYCTNCAPGSYAEELGRTECKPCEIGRYVTIDGAAACVACEVGKVQPETGKAQCVDCVSGKYNDLLAQQACVECPQGQYNNNPGESRCYDCGIGEHMNATGATKCTDCWMGSYGDTMGRQNCIPCSLGQITNATKQDHCLPCELGTFQDEEGKSICKECIPGRYADEENSAICKLCQAGKYNQATKLTSCTVCDEGQYQDKEGKTICLDAPLGAYTATKSQIVPLDCPPGTYLVEEGKTVCAKCDLGFFNPNFNRTACEPCAPGRYSNVLGTVNCLLCEIGKYQGSYQKSVCVDCAAGTSNNITGQSVCRDCVEGTFASLPGRTSCISCLSGSYTNTTRADECIECEAGYHQPNPGSTNCIACERGWFAEGFANPICTQCEPGKFAPSPASPACGDCPAGSVANGQGNYECTQCDKGFYTDAPGKAVCIQCVEGTYQADIGGKECLLCDPGTFAADKGMSYCGNCTAGKYSPELAMSVCAECAAGTHSPQDGAAECTPCLRGYIQAEPGKDFCVQCSEGKYGPDIGMSECLDCAVGYHQPLPARDECIACIPGKFAETAGSPECTDCPRGRFAASPGRGTCEVCNPGTFQPDTGASASCTKCEAGRFQASSDASTCVECIFGKYSGDEALECIECPTGKYTATNNSVVCTDCELGKAQNETGKSFCNDCLMGKYSGTTGKVDCDDCLPGTFSNESRSIECTKCPATTYIDVAGRTVCDPCQIGRYQDSLGTTACELCTAGRYQNVTGQLSCINCEVGRYMGSTNATDCIECPIGTFAEAEETDECLPCQIGKYRNTTGGVECQDCAVGRFQPNANSIDCIDCDPGRFNNGPGQAACIRCAPGSYQDSPGQQICKACDTGRYHDDLLTDRTQCDACEAGKFASSTGSIACTDCAIGSHASIPGLSECTPCEVGRFMPDLGAIECTDCEPGQFAQNPGLTACKPCEPGTHSPEPGMNTCTVCEVGYFQANEGKSVCDECGVGKYSDSTKAESCTLCAEGFFNNMTAKTVCEPCVTGQYQDTQGSFNCTLCEPGGITATPGSKICDPCKPGYYMDESGHTVCKQCSEGTSQPEQGQTACVNCARGRYNGETQRGDCFQCESGKFGNREGLHECESCAAGTHNSRVEQTVCQECAFGYYAAVGGANDCDPCARGKFTDYTRATDCELCPLGRYQDNFFQTSCIACPLGKSINVRGAGLCSDCGSGRFANETGLEDCRECSAGKFSNVGQFVCTDCAKGRFAAANAGQCSECTSGTFAARTGQELCDKCKDNADNTWDYRDCVCKSSFYMNASLHCVPCPTCGDCSKAGTTEFNIQPLEKCFPTISGAVDNVNASVLRIAIYVKPGTYTPCPKDVTATTEFLANSDFREALLKFPTIAAYAERIQVVQPVVGNRSDLFKNCTYLLEKDPFADEGANTNIHKYFRAVFNPELPDIFYFLVDIMPPLPKATDLKNPSEVYQKFLLDLNITSPIDPTKPDYTNPEEGSGGGGDGGGGGSSGGSGGGSGGSGGGETNGGTQAFVKGQEMIYFKKSPTRKNLTKLLARDSPVMQIAESLPESNKNALLEDVKLLTEGDLYNDVFINRYDDLFVEKFNDAQPQMYYNGFKIKSTALYKILDIARDAGIYGIFPTTYRRYPINEFIACLNDACYGAGCSEGYEGNLCTQCAEGYGRTTIFECRKCPPVAQNISLGVGVILAMILICGFLSYRTILAGEAVNSSNEYKPPFPVLMKITMTGLQVMSIAQNMEFQWPGFIGDLLSSSDSAVNVASLISVDCYLKGGALVRPFYMQSVFFLLLPVLALALAASFIGPVYNCKLKDYRISQEKLYADSPLKDAQIYAAMAKNKRIWQGYYITTSTVVLFMLHPNLVRQAFLMLACKKLGEAGAQTYLLADLSERCYTTTHIAFILIVCLPMMVLYVFGIPLITFTYLYKNREIIQLDLNTLTPDLASLAEKKKEFGAKMAFVYQGYLPQYYFWFLAEMIRKTALVAVSVFFIGKLHLQILMAAFAVFMCLLAQLAAQPFENILMDWMEFLSLFCSFCLFFLGNFFFVEGLSQEVEVIVTMVIVIDVFFFVLGVLYCFIWMARYARTNRVADFLKAARQARLVKSYMDTLLGPKDARGRRQKHLTRGLNLPAALVGENPERIPVDMIGAEGEFLEALVLDGTKKDNGVTVAHELVGVTKLNRKERPVAPEIQNLDVEEIEMAPVGARAFVPPVPRLDVKDDQLKVDRLDPRFFSGVDVEEYDPAADMENPTVTQMLKKGEEEVERDQQADDMEAERVEKYTQALARTVHGDDYIATDLTEDAIVPAEVDDEFDPQAAMNGEEEEVVYEYYDEHGNRYYAKEGEVLDGEVVEEYYEEEEDPSQAPDNVSDSVNARYRYQ